MPIPSITVARLQSAMGSFCSHPAHRERGREGTDGRMMKRKGEENEKVKRMEREVRGMKREEEEWKERERKAEAWKSMENREREGEREGGEIW